MTFSYPLSRLAVAVIAAVLAFAGTSSSALAQTTGDLVAVCTDSNGALFRVDNPGDSEFDFTLMGAGESVSGSAYPIGRGGAFAYLPAGASADLLVQGMSVATADADTNPCPSATAGGGRPMCEGIKVDPNTRQALFVGASEFRGVTSIEITVGNGRVLVYDPHALFVVNAGGAPAPVFEVESDDQNRTTATFDTGGTLFNAGYGLLLQGDNDGPVAFFATITSPGGVVECDPQFATAAEPTEGLEDGLSLSQNSPNPFGTSTEIAFTLPEAGDVSLRVYDVLGRQVTTLIDGDLPAGDHTATWNGGDDAGQPVANGTYLYRLESAGQTLSRRMTVLR